jgi:multiple sugar transport system substrate-binding protein
MRHRRAGLLVALVTLVAVTALAAATANGARKATQLNAMFLGATWGTVVKDTLAPEYEKLNPGVKIKVDVVGRDAIHEKMATLFAAQDSSYDIFNLDYNWIPEFGGSGQLVPLTISAADRKDFLPTALKVATWKGKLYGIPQTVHPHLLWYRTDLYGDPKIQAQYKKATGQALTPPKSYDQWLSQIKFFNGKTFNGTKVYGWTAQGATGPYNVHTWLSFMYSWGAMPFNGGFTKSTLSTPKAIAATKAWAAAWKYTPPGSNQHTFAEVTTAAQQGQIATAIQWSWGAWMVDDPTSSKTVGKWQFVQVPAPASHKPAPHLAEWVISISKYSKNQAAAKKFIAWLETKRNDVVQANLGGGDPVRKSTYLNATLTKQTVKGAPNEKRFRRYSEVLKAMATTQPRPYFPREERWETTLTPFLTSIQLGKSSVPDALKKADKAIDDMLNQ